MEKFQEIDIKLMRNPDNNTDSKQKNINLDIIKQKNDNILINVPSIPPRIHGESDLKTDRRVTSSFTNKVEIYFGPNLSMETQQMQKRKFGDNTITTTKYNVFTWFPKSLVMQFKRVANIYFLMISVLTLMPFSPKNPYTQTSTFVMVLLFTMLKEAYEDYIRYKQDKEINYKRTKVYNNQTGDFRNSYWCELKVGDVVKISKDDPIPADILILKTSSDSGLCFVDTKDLDGETNLKEKMVNAEYLHFSEKDLSEISGVIKCDMPNEYLDSWEGNLFSDNLKINVNSIIKNFLLKGSILKNTEYIIGLIVYCGFNTKIMKNAKNPRIKMSYVMKTMNFILKTVFLFQITCCALFSICYLIFTDEKEDSLAYYIISSHEITVRIFVIKFFTFIVAYSHLIPISLYVAMEIVKIFQTWFIFYDNIIYDSEYQKPTYARTSELIEELGQVEFLFSDKTGTLTINKMEFKSCFIGGVLFGDFEGDELNSIENNKQEGDKKKFNKNRIDKSINDDKSSANHNDSNQENNEIDDEDGVEVQNDMDSVRIPKQAYNENRKNFIKEKNNFEENLDFEKFIDKEKVHFAGDKRIANILFSEISENEVLNAFGVSDLNENNNIIESQNNNFDNYPAGVNQNYNFGFGKNNNENFESAQNLYEKYDVLPDANLTMWEFKKKIINFFRVCTLCHSAINEKDKHGKHQFASSSPDEIAFLQGAKKNGFAFSKRTTNTIEILNSYTKEIEKWEILLEIPFDSDRQCMTMILKKKDDEMNTVHIMVKGADSKLVKMLQIDEVNLNSMNHALKSFSCEGLRTLVMGYKTISMHEFNRWLDKYKAIQFSNGSKKEKLEKIYDEIENGLSLAGVSAIEDKLQEGVPETIELLLKSNIRVWVLTGDKEETALNIGRTCRLIEEIGHNEIKLTNLTQDQIERELDKYIFKFNLQDTNDFKQIMQLKLPDNYYMIVSGICLIYILKSQTLSNKFFKIGLICRSVICCRVTGSQKSQVVSLIKRKGNWITLSVGDGTNDVPMLMEAHIGVGVQGKEGTQAVRSADYGICQFRFLQRLLLIHGRNGYRRISTFICYYFYKNIILVFAEIYFVFFSGFSGQPFFPDFLPILYNSVWTSWPCIFAFSIESDLIDHTYKKMALNLLKNKNNLLGKYFEILPAFYRAGQVKYYFNLKVFWLWLLYAILHGGLAYLFITTGIINHAVWGDGKLVDHWWITTVIFSSIIHIVTYKIFVEVTYWNKLIILTSVLSIFVYYLSIYIINLSFVSFAVQNELAQKVTSMFMSRTYWIYTISMPVFIVSIDLIVKFVYRFYRPDPLDLIKLKKVVFKDSENIIEKISTMKNPQDQFRISQKKIFEHSYNKPNLEMAKL